MKELVCIKDDWIAMPGNPYDGAPMGTPKKGEIYHPVKEWQYLNVMLVELEEFPKCGWDKEHFAELPENLHTDIQAAIKEPVRKNEEAFAILRGLADGFIKKNFGERESEASFSLRMQIAKKDFEKFEISEQEIIDFTVTVTFSLEYVKSCVKAMSPHGRNVLYLRKIFDYALSRGISPFEICKIA